jgi:hypothetical protein
MAADVLGAGVDGDIDAQLERRGKIRRDPGIVGQHGNTAGMRGARDGGNILHLEGERTGRFAQDGAGVVAQQPGDAAAYQRVVILDLDPHGDQTVVAKAARRRIGRIADQQMLAGLEHGNEGNDDGRQAVGRGDRLVGALQPRHGFLEGEGRGRAVAAVADRLLAEIAGSFVVLQRRVNDGGGPENGGIDHAGVLFRSTSGMRQQRIGLGHGTLGMGPALS